MLGLCLSLALLGLSAIDPLGLGIVPMLLLQRDPYKRCAAFLGGSFVSLMLMGVLFARGFGAVLLHFTPHRQRVVVDLELIAGLLLLILAGFLSIQLQRRRIPHEPSARLRRWLKLDNWHLALFGAALVAVQSLLDVVFLIAMVRAGQFRLTNAALLVAVASYAVMALALQVIVVILFRYSAHPRKLLRALQTLVSRYGQQTVIAVSTVLGIILLILAGR